MRDVRRGIGALGVAAALSAGSHLWSRALGEPDPRLSVQVRSVAGHGSGAALVAGSLTGRLALALALERPLTSSPAGKDPFLLLFDSEGVCRQSLLLGGSGARDLASAAFDPAGNVVLAGELTGSLELGGRRLVTPDRHPSSGFVARLDRRGQLQWLKHLTSEPSARIDIHGAAAGARGEVVASGYVDGKRLALDGADLGVSNQFVIELDPAGRVAWSKSLHAGVADSQPPVLDPSGNAVLGFVSESLERIHVIKLDPAGNELWHRRLGGGLTQDLTGLAVDSAGDILLAGRGGLGEAPPEGELGFVARLDPEGRVLAVRRGKTIAYASVAAGDRGSVLVAGGAPLSADWGGAAVRGAGTRFVARLDAGLRPVWVARLEGDVGPSLTVGSLPGRAALVAGSFRGPIALGGRLLPGGAGENAFAAALAP
jgi:hypothetical protein